ASPSSDQWGQVFLSSFSTGGRKRRKKDLTPLAAYSRTFISEGSLIGEDERLWHAVADWGDKLRLADLALGERAERLVAGGVGHNLGGDDVPFWIDRRVNGHDPMRGRAVGERRRRRLGEAELRVRGAALARARPLADHVQHRHVADGPVGKADAVPLVAERQ